jgi:hemerythrin superfamily protein
MAARRVLVGRSMTEHAHPTSSDDLRTLLGHEHERMNTLFTDVVDAFDSGSPQAAAEQFSALEAQLEAHMRMEEEHVLPGLARVDAREARELREEHDAIRATLADLAVRVDLHTARTQAIAELVRTLHAHARREDGLAYRWAEQHLEPSLVTQLRDAVRARLARLAR